MDKRRLLQKIREQTDQDMVLSMLQASRQGEHRERDRIAAQLHSNIRPLLQEVQLQLDDIQQHQLATQRSVAFMETQSIVGDVQEELEHIATALSNDMPSPGLVAMVRRFIHNIPGDNDLSVNLKVSGEERALPPESEQVIYRILQELVQNIMKHAHARNACISIDYGAASLNIRVQDDGLGFSTQSFDQGLGWPNIQERVRQLKGSCSRFNDAGTIVLIGVSL
ncbi:MAG: hypothetical protein EOP49_37050 [Sphingobacteriales bacterium]|nr:MAG: hypothetical protein EOP49_37050 [Sphingobacteriales bacterium]